MWLLRCASGAAAFGSRQRPASRALFFIVHLGNAGGNPAIRSVFVQASRVTDEGEERLWPPSCVETNDHADGLTEHHRKCRRAGYSLLGASPLVFRVCIVLLCVPPSRQKRSCQIQRAGQASRRDQEASRLRYLTRCALTAFQYPLTDCAEVTDSI